jgi:dTDP-4-dehydrorhamnose reductase
VRRDRLEVWAGVESSRVRVGRRIVDQLQLTGHWDRASDLDRLAELGVSAVRYPVLWEHVAPRGLGAANWAWADRRLARLRALGVRPVLGLLHHGQGPRGISLLHPGFATAFGRYAAAVARRFPWVDAYVPLNEPLATARFAGLYGWWWPHARSERTFARLLLVQCAAIRAAARAVRDVNPEARIIVNDDVGRTFATEPLAADAAYLNERRWLAWDLLTGRVTRDHPMHELLTRVPENRRLVADLAADPEPPDVIGIDHYVTSDRFLDHRVGLYVAERRDPLVPGYVDVEACRVPGVPTGSISRAIDDSWARYRRPLILSEIAIAGLAADQVHWWNEAYDAASAARARGVDLGAITAWAAFGSVDWHCLMRRAEGVYEPGLFDARSDPPRARPVAAAVRQSALGADAYAPVASAPIARGGWWLRADRYL